MTGAAGSAAAARIAMWSGPRTVSTALMRAWENRPDTVVTDEPLYAFYLSRTGLDHPGRDQRTQRPGEAAPGGRAGEPDDPDRHRCLCAHFGRA